MIEKNCFQTYSIKKGVIGLHSNAWLLDVKILLEGYYLDLDCTQISDKRTPTLKIGIIGTLSFSFRVQVLVDLLAQLQQEANL